MNCNFKISSHLNTINQISTQKSVLRSREIDQQLMQDQELRKKEIQILVLGNRNSGKTTFLKQFRIHHGDGYPYLQRAILVPDILSNLADAIHIVMDNMARWDLRFEDPYVQTLAKDFHNNCPRSPALSNNPHNLFKSIQNNSPRPFNRFCKTVNRITDFCLHIKNISDQDDFQECLDCKEFFKPSITYADLYFIQNIDRLIQADYTPTLQDIMVMRKPTYSVKDFIFNLGGITLRFIDLGGYKCQRKKFIHYFEGVSTVFYFCALSEYSEIIEETTKNKLNNSLENFEEIINNKYLWRKDFVIFLNKSDLFKSKVENLSINVFFSDFEGNPSDVEDGINFFRMKFLSLKPANAPKTKKIYTHVTCCLDIDKMKFIIKQIIQNMLDSNVKRMTLF